MNPKVKELYKRLLFMGRDYPTASGGYGKFRDMLKLQFQQTKIEKSEDLEKALEKGAFVEKEALYFLSRYRTMKRRYYNE